MVSGAAPPLPAHGTGGPRTNVVHFDFSQRNFYAGSAEFPVKDTAMDPLTVRKAKDPAMPGTSWRLEKTQLQCANGNALGENM